MSIGPSGCFTYTAVMRHGTAGGWHGRAQPARDAARHPGLVADHPQLELIGGTLSIRRAESWISRKWNRHYRDWGKPAARVRLAIGPVVEAIAEDGDELTVFRTGTGDCGVTLKSGRQLKVGLGAVRGDEAIRIEEDPRAEETSLYGDAATLAADAASLVWLDISDPDHESVVRHIECLPAGRWIIAITGGDRDARRRMNHRVAGFGRPIEGSRRYVDVDERFRNQDQWLAYLRALPRSRPADLWIRFAHEDGSLTLREGEYGFMAPWHFFVYRVFTPGLPGKLSQIGMARDHPAISQEMVVESVRMIAPGLIEIKD